MLFNIIDIESWNRKETYYRFMNDTPCTYSITVNLDIDNFLMQVQNSNRKFFPSFLFALSHTVNRHKEFRMGFDEENNLGYFTYSNPYYTIFHSDIETFTNVWSEYDEDIDRFLLNYISDMAEYQDKASCSKPLAKNNYFNVSSLPWTSFAGFNLNLQNGYDYLLPIFTIGKYHTENDKTIIPLAIQIHHAVCDGYHVSRFVDDLQNFLNLFKG